MIVDRATEDYSPLQGPIINPHTGKDIRPRWMRQKYEAAVNARREMLAWIAGTPEQKITKRQYERIKFKDNPAGNKALKSMIRY